MIEISKEKALWIAQRINKCDCVEKLMIDADGQDNLIIEYALAIPAVHKCLYKDYICPHNYPAIECYYCFEKRCDNCNQPERSKRENSYECCKMLSKLNDIFQDHRYLNDIRKDVNDLIKECEMRCSEHERKPREG